MAIEHSALIRDRVEGTFHCRRCDARARVSYLAAGGGAVREGILNNREEAQQKAERDAEENFVVDAQRVLRYLRCPKCHRRNPGALMYVYAIVAVTAIISLAAALSLHGDPQQAIPIGGGLIILIAFAVTHGRLRRGNAARFTIVDPSLPRSPVVAPPRVRAADDVRPSVLG